jgi:hypothetical protein
MIVAVHPSGGSAIMSNGSNVIVREKNDTITIKHHSPKVEPNSRQEKELARGLR